MSRHKPWKVIASTPVYRFDPWLAVERQKVELSDGRIVDDYHRITLQDFAGIVAQSEDGRAGPRLPDAARRRARSGRDAARCRQA